VVHAITFKPCNSSTWLLKRKELPLTCRLISRQRGEHSSLLRTVFSFCGFHYDQMAMLKLLMILEVPHSSVICLAPYHLQVGPTAGQALPHWGPFHQICIYSSLWFNPQPAGGLCSFCQACWEASVANNPSGLRVCTCFTILCLSLYWRVFAEGTNRSQASCSNRTKMDILCKYVNTNLYAGIGIWTYNLCTCFLTSDLSIQMNEVHFDP